MAAVLAASAAEDGAVPASTETAPIIAVRITKARRSTPLGISGSSISTGRSSSFWLMACLRGARKGTRENSRVLTKARFGAT